MGKIINSNDLAVLIRERRQQLMLSQAQLALQVGVSRQWIIDVEKGKPRAELQLVLTLLHALGICLHASVEKRPVLATLDMAAGEAKIRELANSFSFLER